MEYRTLQIEALSINIAISTFSSERGGVEHHVMINIQKPLVDVKMQFERLQLAVNYLLTNVFDNNTSLVWSRYFMSDPANQSDQLEDKEYAISLTGQAPLNYAKAAMWCYFVENVEIKNKVDCTSVERSGYTHFFHTGLHSLKGNEYEQTENVFESLRTSLKNNRLSFSKDLIRTWIYVQGVDTHYDGMVRARKKIFEEEDLTEDTHYIASTGIEGCFIYPESLVFMDAYTVGGLEKGQVCFLSAPEYLSSTSIYGVTFERGTLIEYGDRKHLFISGTASINKFGEILHPQNIIEQTKQTLVNIKALLNEGGADMNDLAQLIIYLRDTADYPLVFDYIESLIPHIPKAYLLAPVCRPGWLIEMECIAICQASNNNYRPF